MFVARVSCIPFPVESEGLHVFVSWYFYSAPDGSPVFERELVSLAPELVAEAEVRQLIARHKIARHSFVDTSSAECPLDDHLVRGDLRVVWANADPGVECGLAYAYVPAVPGMDGECAVALHTFTSGWRRLPRRSRRTAERRLRCWLDRW